MFNQEIANLMPGMGPTKTAAYRHIWKSFQGVQYAAGGGIINGAKSRDLGNTGNTDTLRAGLLMGKITASGKYAPCVIGVTGSAITGSSSTSITVSLAVATEIIRRIGTSGSLKITGPATADGTMHEETVVFTAVTLNGASSSVTFYATTTYSFIAGSLIGAADGSHTPKTFIDAEDGIHVTFAGTDYDVQFPRMPLGGQVDTAGIINYTADTSINAWIKDALNAVGHFVFSDNL